MLGEGLDKHSDNLCSCLGGSYFVSGRNWIWVWKDLYVQEDLDVIGGEGPSLGSWGLHSPWMAAQSVVVQKGSVCNILSLLSTKCLDASDACYVVGLWLADKALGE